MKHATLISLRIQHAFYRDGCCPDFRVVVSEDTARVLRNHRCLFLARDDGFVIATELADSTHPFAPLPSQTELRFYLQLQNPDFSRMTDLSKLAAVAAPCFTNVGAAAGSDGTVLVLAAPESSAASLPQAAFAELLLRCDSTLGQSFRLTFAARRMRWAYYCVVDQIPSGVNLRIVDASPSGTSDVLSFADSNRTDLGSHPDPDDAIGQQLASRFPTMRRIRLLSDSPVACRQEARKYLELRLADERIVAPLPNPSLRNMAAKDVLFEVIKYRSQPLSPS